MPCLLLYYWGLPSSDVGPERTTNLQVIFRKSMVPNKLVFLADHKSDSQSLYTLCHVSPSVHLSVCVPLGPHETTRLGDGFFK